MAAGYSMEPVSSLYGRQQWQGLPPPPQAQDANMPDVIQLEEHEIQNITPFRYKKIPASGKRIRLLQLRPGFPNIPQIDCELFEVEFDADGIAREVVNGVMIKPTDPRSRSSAQQRRRAGDGSGSDEDGDAPPRGRTSYEALSWCWGSDRKDCMLMIHRGGQGYPHLVTRELALALKHLRWQDCVRTLWIDAICINQDDDEERNHQVQMMARIYTCAEQVCVWLGQQDANSNMAIRFIEDEIIKLEDFDGLCSNKDNAIKWQSLLILMQRPWFSRRWVVQELALARDATIYCGLDMIPWRDFAIAVELFVEVETATHRLSEVMQKAEIFYHMPGLFEHVSELGASLLVQATGKVFRSYKTEDSKTISGPHVDRIRQATGAFLRRFSTNGGNRSSNTNPSPANDRDQSDRRGLLSLEYLVSSLYIFEATQPRDAIYALLAIAQDTTPFAEASSIQEDKSPEALVMATVSSFLLRKPYLVDYGRPYSDVCKDFLFFCIQRAHRVDQSRALDILCRPWAPDGETDVSRKLGAQRTKHIPYKYMKKRKRLSLFKRDPNKKLMRTQDAQPPLKDAEGQIVQPPLIEGDGIDEDRTAKQHGERIRPQLTQSAREYYRPFIPKRSDNPKSLDLESLDDYERASSAGPTPVASSASPDDCDLPLPSWVGRVADAAFALFPHDGMQEKLGRKNADPLVGLPQDGYRNYSAAQTKKVDLKKVRFRKRPVLGHYSLYVEGFILDKVKEVSEAARHGGIPRDWTRLAGWDALRSVTDPPDEFWRTLVADRGKDNRNPPYYYAKACKESVYKGGLLSGGVDTKALVNNTKNSIIAEFCRRVQAVIFNRVLIRTEAGALGLVKENVRVGDLICIIYGCTVPVILRRVEKANPECTIEEEKREDGFEAFRRCMERCEQSRIRKLQYRKTIEKAGDNKDLYEQEIQDLTRMVNGMIHRWRKEKLEEKKRKEDQETEWKTVKADIDKRLAERKAERKIREQQQNEGSSANADNDPGNVDTNNEQNQEAETMKADDYYYYTFLGESYIHEMMDGEAMRKQYEEQIPEKIFELR